MPNTTNFLGPFLPPKQAANCAAEFVRFSDGTVLEDFHALGYLAKGNTYCVAPVRLPGSSTEPVRYWAVGKNCCDRRLG